MAINKRFTQLNNSGSNHNLLDALSGKITGSLEVTGSAYFKGGLSGSLQMLIDGTTMFLTGGPGITITNQPNGQIAITGSAGAGSSSPEYWDSTTTASIFTTGSVLIRSDDGSLTDSASDYGTDTFFFVSGAIDGVINGDGVAAFGGDVVVSGNLIISGVNSANANYPSGLYVYGPGTIYGTLTVGDALDPDVAYFNSQLTASAGINTPIIGSAGGSVTVIAPLTASVGLDLSGNSVFQAGSTFTFNGNGVFAAGLTGSLQEVSAGVPYLLAGDYITLATNSLGQIAISASNIPGTEVYWNSYVNGVIKAENTSSMVEVPYLSSSNGLEVTGSAVFIGGITGSLHWINEAETVPFLVAGPNAEVNFNNGQWEITGSGDAQPQWYYTPNTGEIGTSGSVAIDANLTVTGSAIITGSLKVAPAGTGRGLLRVGGLDIGPITGSLTMTYTDGTETGIISGSVLSASNGVWDGTNPVVLRHELHVLGLGVDDGLFPVETFAATYLVMTYIDSSGVQTVKAVTELSRETSGSRAATYDINFAPNGDIEATGSLPANYSANIKWYVQRVKEMSLSYDLTLT